MTTKLLVEQHLQPYTASCDEYEFGYCPICKKQTMGFILDHNHDCYWYQQGYKHIRREKIGEKPNAYCMYNIYRWETVPK